MSGAAPIIVGEHRLPSSSAGRRNSGLDFAKGVFVVAMVLHHCLNYFPQELEIIKAVRFVSGAYVFLCGFLISSYYAPKIWSGEQSVYRRLAARGARLLLLFLFLNACTRLLLPNRPFLNSAGQASLGSWFLSLFITGDYRTLDFDLLVPIGYVLLLSVPILWTFQRRMWAYAVAIAGILGIAAFFPDIPGRYYLRYTSIGFVGLGCGLLPQSVLNPSKWPVKSAALAYLLHLIILPFITLTFQIYVLLVLGNAAVFYVIGAGAKKVSNWPVWHMLGRYSLFCYLWQIALLQVLRRTMPKLQNDPLNLLAAFALTMLFTWAGAWLVDSIRKRSKPIDVAYRFAFA